MPVEINARVVDYAGTPAILSVIRDITDRKKIERKYSTLVETSNDSILIMQDGLLKYVNVVACQMTGYAKNEVLEKPFLNYISSAYKEIAWERYEKRLKGQNPPNNYEIEILAKDGHKTPVEVNAFLSEHEDRPAVVAIMRDLTDRKKDEEEHERKKKEIEQSEVKYRGLIENTPMCIKVFDKDGKLIFLNKGGREEHGIKEGDDLLKWDWLGTVKSGFIPAAKKVFEEALKGKSGEVEFEHTESSKAHPWCHGLISPILDEKGKVINVLFYSVDVTERKNQKSRF
jgi:PAS domain S-box-containing protein